MFAAALALLTFTAAPVPKDAEKSAKDLMQGEWKVVKFLRNGQADDLEKQPLAVTITGDRLGMRKNGRTDTVIFTLNSTTKPGAMNLTRDDDPCRIPALAIYKFEDGLLTICFNLDGVTRPTKFESLEESNTGLFVLERVKK